MATFEATRSPKCCPWTNQGYLTFPHTPRRPRPDPREAYARAYPNRVGPVDLTLAGPAGTSCPALEGAGPGAPLRSVTDGRREGPRGQTGPRRCRGPSGQMSVKSISTAADATSRAARFSGGSETYLKAPEVDKRCCNTFFANLLSATMQSCDVKSHFGREDLHFPTPPHGSETALTRPPADV